MIAGVYALYHEKEMLLANAEGHRRTVIDIQADALVNPLWDLDSARADTILSFFNRMNDIISVRVLDDNKKEFSTFLSSEHQNLKSDGVVTKEIFHSDTPDAPIGYLEVRYTNDIIRNAMAEQVGFFSLVFVSLLIFIIASLSFALNLYAAPISKIRKVMKAFSRGEIDIDVPYINRADEIGALAKTAQSFKDSLIARDHAELQAEEERKQNASDLQRMTDNLRQQFGYVIRQAQLGDFSASIDVSVFRDPNLKELAKNINHLMSNISDNLANIREALFEISHGNIAYEMHYECSGVFFDLQTDINSTTTCLKNFYFDIQKVISNFKKAADIVANDALDMERRNENILNFVRKAVCHIGEVNQGIEKNSINAENACSLSEKSVVTAEDGNKSLMEAVETVELISEGSGHILHIVDIIEAIAMNTNLLALNAAVEAAHAGEAGKSFTIVASEVRSLAGSVAKASEDIKGLLQNNVEDISTGVKKVKELGGRLNSIRHYISDMSEAIETISEQGQEQSENINDISKMIVQLEEMTRDAGQIVKRSTVTAQEMTDNADSLTQKIQFFKVA